MKRTEAETKTLLSSASCRPGKQRLLPGKAGTAPAAPPCSGHWCPRFAFAWVEAVSPWSPPGHCWGEAEEVALLRVVSYSRFPGGEGAEEHVCDEASLFSLPCLPHSFPPHKKNCGKSWLFSAFAFTFPPPHTLSNFIFFPYATGFAASLFCFPRGISGASLCCSPPPPPPRRPHLPLSPSLIWFPCRS